MFITGRSVPEHEPFDEPITAIRCDHGDDRQVDAAFDRIQREAGTIDVLVNNVWGGYERMIDDGRSYLNVTDEELRRELEVSWNNKGRPLRLAAGG